MKVCTRCKIEKDNSCFKIRVNKKTKCGTNPTFLNPTCRVCDNELASIYYIKMKTNPVFVEKNRKYAKNAYHEYKEKYSQRIKNYRNKPESKVKAKEYYVNNYGKLNRVNRENSKKYRTELTDNFIKNFIRSVNNQKRKMGKTILFSPENPEHIRIIKKRLVITRIKKTLRKINEYDKSDS